MTIGVAQTIRVAGLDHYRAANLHAGTYLLATYSWLAVENWLHMEPPFGLHHASAYLDATPSCMDPPLASWFHNWYKYASYI